jgi:hypothetical protein
MATGKRSSTVTSPALSSIPTAEVVIFRTRRSRATIAALESLLEQARTRQITGLLWVTKLPVPLQQLATKLKPVV